MWNITEDKNKEFIEFMGLSGRTASFALTIILQTVYNYGIREWRKQWI